MEAAAQILVSGKRDEPVAVVSQHYIPEKTLSEFVGVFWYWRGHEVPRSKERILPMGDAELVIDLRSTRASGAGVSGPQSRSFIIERTSSDELLGVHFNVGGALPFQLFRDGVGLTPKLFCRVQRFREVIKTVEKQRHVDWTDVALSRGYFSTTTFESSAGSVRRSTSSCARSI